MLSHLTPRNKPIHLSRMHFLCLKALTPSMNTTLASNTRANSYLSNEPKTRSPLPPPSLPAQQTTQAIHSSISASSLSTSSSAHCSTSPSRANARPCYIVGRAFVLMSRARYKNKGLSLTCTPGSLWECCRTQHLETSLSVVFSRSRSRPLRSFYHRARANTLEV